MMIDGLDCSDCLLRKSIDLNYTLASRLDPMGSNAMVYNWANSGARSIALRSFVIHNCANSTQFRTQLKRKRTRKKCSQMLGDGCPLALRRPQLTFNGIYSTRKQTVSIDHIVEKERKTVHVIGLPVHLQYVYLFWSALRIRREKHSNCCFGGADEITN